MKNLLVLAVFSILTSSVYAQSDKNVEESQFKINFINPGIEYEVAIGDYQTLDFGIGLQFLGAETFNEFNYALIPAINAQYRYYTNFERRIRKGKPISGNSGNYIAGSVTLFTSDVIIGNVESGDGFAGFVGPVYGIQRTYDRGFNFGMEFGVGVYFSGANDFDAIDTGIGPTVSFSIGWVLRKKKK